MANEQNAQQEWAFAEQAEAVLAAAKATGGEITDEDRISGVADQWPFFVVVGKTSKDAEYYDEALGLNVSRAGQFRAQVGSEIKGYFKDLWPLVVVDARVTYQAWLDGEVVSRAISTVGLNQPRVIQSKYAPIGFDITESPLWKWREGDYRHPLTGQAIKDEEKYKSGLDLFCWSPKDDPEGKRPFRVGFSASSIKVYRTWAGKVENEGVRVWSFWVGVKPELVRGEQGRSDYYVPDFKIGGALREDQFSVACLVRENVLQRLGVEALAAKGRALQAGTQVKALPGGIAEVHTPQVLDSGDDIFADQ